MSYYDLDAYFEQLSSIVEDVERRSQSIDELLHLEQSVDTVMQSLNLLIFSSADTTPIDTLQEILNNFWTFRQMVPFREKMTM